MAMDDQSPLIFRKISDTLDTFRIMPRIMVAAYGWLVWHLTQWFIAIKSVPQLKCDPAIAADLLAKHVPVEQVKQFACYVGDYVGGATTEQTTFVSIIAGLSSAVMYIYVNNSVAPGQAGPIPTMRAALHKVLKAAARQTEPTDKV